MGLKWQVRTFDPEEFDEGLALWEPFAIVPGGVVAKREIFVETDEAKSSVHNPNFAGNEPDAADE